MGMSYRYMGNKTRLLPSLMEITARIVPTGSIVADLMCGTAAVSEALRICDYRVFASDLMTFSAQHARVRLLLNAPPSFERLQRGSYIEIQRYLNDLGPKEGLFFREYGPLGRPSNGSQPRKYFSAENAARIDAITWQLNEWRDGRLLSELENSLLRHDLVLACNRVANIAGTYGHHRAKWSQAATSVLALRPSVFIREARIDHVVCQGAAEEIAGRVEADLCYLDPPYMKRQYAANYHIIETIARGDAPVAVGVSGLRPWRDQYSDFCSRVKIHKAFRRVLSEVATPHFLVSYSEDGLLPVDELEELFSEFGEVLLYRIPASRFKSNSGGKGGVVMEYVFHIVRD